MEFYRVSLDVSFAMMKVQHGEAAIISARQRYEGADDELAVSDAIAGRAFFSRHHQPAGASVAIDIRMILV